MYKKMQKVWRRRTGVWIYMNDPTFDNVNTMKGMAHVVLFVVPLIHV